MPNTFETFLRDRGLESDAIDREALLAAFLREMEAGLSGEKSSLLMIPSYVDPSRPVATGRPVAVLDAGGTNLRAARVVLDAKSGPEIGSFARRAMPGTEGELSEDEFFMAFADFAAPALEGTETVGFCFSYPAEILPDGDARLLHWSKQIAAPSVVGKLIGSGLKARLAARGAGRRIVIVNDTVATLLAGKSAGAGKRYSAYVGFILGTGTNTAYVEKNSNIRKLAGLPSGGSMIINVESGGFASIARSQFDDQFDATTNDPGHYRFEKLLSGAYLGSVGRLVLLGAASEGLLSPAAARWLNETASLSTKDLDDFCGGAAGAENPFAGAAFTEDDRVAVRELCTPIFARGAILTAVNIAAAVIKTGEGQDAAAPVCVNVDGSTFHKTRTAEFRRRVKRELEALLGPRGIHCELVKIEDSPVIGSAVAGLM